MSSEEKVDLAQKAKERGIDPRLVAAGIATPAQAPTWDVPVLDVDLPSRGKVYPVESNLHNREKVEIRGMTAKEEDILTSRSLIRQGKAMSMLLKNCIMDKSINPDEMLSGDRNAILVAIRMSGYGQEYNTKIECPECDEAYEHEFDVAAVSKVVELTQEPDELGKNIFSFKLPVSKKLVKFKLLNGAEDRELTTAMDRSRKALGVGAPESNVTMRLHHQIVSIDGSADKKLIKRFVDTMPAMDSRALRVHIAETAPGLEMKSFVMCPACGEESEVEMPIGPEFFWPDIG